MSEQEPESLLNTEKRYVPMYLIYKKEQGFSVMVDTEVTEVTKYGGGWMIKDGDMAIHKDDLYEMLDFVDQMVRQATGRECTWN